MNAGLVYWQHLDYLQLKKDFRDLIAAFWEDLGQLLQEAYKNGEVKTLGADANTEVMSDKIKDYLLEYGMEEKKGKQHPGVQQPATHNRCKRNPRTIDLIVQSIRIQPTTKTGYSGHNSFGTDHMMGLLEVSYDKKALGYTPHLFIPTETLTDLIPKTQGSGNDISNASNQSTRD
jgi:hypothetical protein